MWVIRIESLFIGRYYLTMRRGKDSVFTACILDKSVSEANKSALLCILAMYIASHSDLFHPDND